jgi:acetyl coenzyme A synthetase (ADP forming)-like protein
MTETNRASKGKQLDTFFSAKSIAVIGASREQGKIGNVIFANLLRREFKGKAFPVNPNAKEVLGRKCYASVRDIPESVELAVIAVPAPAVPKVIDECGKKSIRHAIIISSGFKEVSNTKLDNELCKALERNKIAAVGPNCLGVLDTTSQLDTLFLPRERLLRPRQGGISFISQSGALSSAVLDLAAQEGYGFAKFVSYGNALNLDESDFLEYLTRDTETKVICLYIEGVHDGKKFLAAATKAAQAKPVIVLKGGMTEAGSKATLSHTGSLAGAAEVYLGAFRQAGLVVAYDIEEVFDYLKVFEKLSVRPRGNRVQVITNGGGYGIITADELSQAKHLQMATLAPEIAKQLKKQFLPIAVISNPLDVLGDATEERYRIAIDACLKDKNNDILLVVILPQTPLLKLDALAQQAITAAQKSKKPVIAIVTGSAFAQRFARRLEDTGIPCYEFPVRAVRALDALAGYSRT